MAEPRRSLADKLHAVPLDGYGDEELELDDELGDDGVYRAFIVSRQANRRPEMINFKLKDGRQHCFDYSHLYKIDFEPSEGVVMLGFSDHKVTVTGLQLGELYQRLLGRRVLQVTEADTPTAKLMRLENEEPLVMEILVGSME